MEEPIRVLQIAHGMETFGGVESFLLQHYKHINKDLVRWDFLFCCNDTFEKCKDDLVLMDSKITALHDLKTTGNSLKNYIQMIIHVNEYLKKSNYDIVHINTANVFLQFIFAIGLRTTAMRIAHSHSAKAVIANPSSKDKIKLFLKNMLEPILKIWIRKNNDYLLACSRTAGESLFGRQGVKLSNFIIVKNAIETDKFEFNESVRERIRDEIGIKDGSVVYGTVGRLAESKNLLFLIDVFERIYKDCCSAYLLIIGDGPMKNKIDEKIQEKSLGPVVKLLGERENVSEWLQGMDCFIFPTMYEGLGIAAIESQAAGLLTITSDAVPVEAKVTDLFHSISLKADADEWASEIEKILSKKPTRRNTKYELVNKGYDIVNAAKDLEMFYLNSLGAKKA